MQPVDVFDAATFVNLVNRPVDDAELDHLRSERAKEPAIRRAASRREFRPPTGNFIDRGRELRGQLARGRVVR